MKTECITYASRVDKTGPLLADVAMVPDDKPKPILVVMHGYNGSKANVSQDLRELSAKGLVAIAPDMRGRGLSAGRWDSGGLDVHDILDAVLETVLRYPREVDARNLNIVGYSGGGANAIACAVRFPDFFQTCVSLFGLSDYAEWYRSKTRPDCNEVMDRVLGGSPDAVPDVYEARCATAAACNAMARLHFFWDSEEKICLPKIIRDFLEAHRQAGRATPGIHVSGPGDALRWHHGYRSDNPDLSAADAIYLPDVLSAKQASPALPPRGRLVVNGYLVTRRFSVWIEDAKKGSVKGRVAVAYDLAGPKPTVKVVDNPRGYRVAVEASTVAGLP